MSDLNKWMGIGRLGQDPTSNSMPSGDIACNFSIATTEKWKDKNSGEQKEATEWHRIAVFGGLAKVCVDYLRKGQQVYIEGKLRTRKWTDKQGNERFTTEILCQTMQMLGSKGDNPGAAAPARNTRPTGPAPGPEGGNSDKEQFDDDIPF